MKSAETSRNSVHKINSLPLQCSLSLAHSRKLCRNILSPSVVVVAHLPNTPTCHPVPSTTRPPLLTSLRGIRRTPRQRDGDEQSRHCKRCLVAKLGLNTERHLLHIWGRLSSQEGRCRAVRTPNVRICSRANTATCLYILSVSYSTQPNLRSTDIFTGSMAFAVCMITRKRNSFSNGKWWRPKWISVSVPSPPLGPPFLFAAFVVFVQSLSAISLR